MSRTLEELDAYKVLHLALENNYLDSSGQGNHGTPTGVDWIPTPRGFKPRFSGAGQINCGEVEYGDKLTVALWVKPEEDTVHAKGIIGDHSNTVGGFAIGYYNEKFICHVKNASSYLYSGYKTAKYNEGKLVHVICTIENTSENTCQITFYINGQFSSQDTESATLVNITRDLYIGNSRYYGTMVGGVAEVRMYTAIFDSTECAALYNSIKQVHGVIPACRTYTHRLNPPSSENDVVSFDMRTRNSDGTLIDLSGNSNHGEIIGAVRSGGYFTDGLRFDGVDDKIQLGTDNSLDITGDMCVEWLGKPNGLGASMDGIISRLDYPGDVGYAFGFRAPDIFRIYLGQTNAQFEGVVDTGVTQHFIINKSGSTIKIIKNGELVGTFENAVINPNPSDTAVIGVVNDYSDGELNYISTQAGALLAAQYKARFNTLAALPLFTFNPVLYPTTSGWTGLIPYSALRVSSGTFEFTDAGQLVCSSAGTIKMQNGHHFDGSEYITLTINGVEYSGTTTVTQGTVTATIEQGSGEISVQMGTDDVLDHLLVQFREPVA